jgi:hypothetical protein
MRAVVACFFVSVLFLPQILAQTSVVQEWLGDANGDQFGYAVDGAGDVNNDGVPDVIIGANRDDNNGSGSGSVAVYSGADGALLHSWNGSGTNAQMGAAVAGVGDVDQDGYDDVLFSELNPYTSTAGVAYLRSGQDGSVIHQWSGGGGDFFGFALAGIGDITGDTVPDVAVSASVETAAIYQGGKVYLFNGATGGVIRSYEGTAWNAQMGSWIGGGKDLSGDGVPDHAVSTANQNLVQVFCGASGAELYSLSHVASFGSHLEFSDDVDGDARADFIVGNFSSPGNAYLYSGTDGSLIWSVAGQNSLDGFGWGIAALGDTNGDAVPDFAVGANGVDNVASASGTIMVFSGTDGSKLVEYNGNAYGAYLGIAVAGLGDVDGDGMGDMVVAAMPPFHAPTFPGYVRIYSGGCQGAAVEYGTGLAGSGGFVPHLSAQGCPGISTSFGITVDQALGGAAGVLILGFSAVDVPFVGGSLLSGPPLSMIPLVTPGVGNGAGIMTSTSVLNDDPGLVNLQFYLQAVLADAGAPQGYSMSNGLSVLVR